MVLEDFLSYSIMQAVKGENVSIRILQVVFAYGVATLLYNILPEMELYILVGLLVVMLILYSYSRNKLENILNDIMYQLITEAMSLRKVIGLVNSVLFNNRNLLDDMFKYISKNKTDTRRLISYFRVSIYFIAPALLLFISLVLMFLILNSVSPSKLFVMNFNVGCVLLLLVYVLIVIFRIKPVIHTSPRREFDFHHLASSVVEKYTYENIVRAKSIPVSLLSLLVLLFPLPKLDIKTPSFWFGLYLCSGKLAELIKEMKDSGKASVEGEITEFFDCRKTGGTEKWVELQEISVEEMLDKITGEEGGKSKQTLKITIRDRGKNVAYIVMKAWKGCKIRKRLRRNPKGGYKLTIDEVSEWKIVSVFIVGIREYVEALRMRIELSSRKASAENILCEEQ